MHIFISAGEPSGDLHGANLIRELKRIDPNVRIAGFGGDRMAAAGCHLLYPLCNHSVMWFLHVVKQVFTFLRLLDQASEYFQSEKPDVVVIIDYPGFHWKLAYRARAQAYPSFILCHRKSGPGLAGASRKCVGAWIMSFPRCPLSTTG